MLAQPGQADSEAGPAGAGNSVFTDLHTFLGNAVEESASLKRLVQEMDEKRRGELEELRKELEKQRFERRDAMNKIRYEFEENVHKKVDKIFEEVEAFKIVEDKDDDAQQLEIDDILADMNRMKRGLLEVQVEWQKLVATTLTERLPQ